MAHTDKISEEIIDLLNSVAERINNPNFIPSDPVQFPRKFTRLEDIEIVALISALLAWGNRKLICRDIERVIESMDYQPFQYMMEKEYENLDPRQNVHRTFFTSDLIYLLAGLRRIYNDYGNLDNFSFQTGCGKDAFPSWKLVENMNKVFIAENEGKKDHRVLPNNLDTTALKRINMALRWLVRDDGIVDMGVWSSINKKQLYIPLDVHVGNVSRELGLLSRKSNDRKSVVELTEKMRLLNPEDPVIYDFALFGIGVEGKNKLSN